MTGRPKWVWQRTTTALPEPYNVVWLWGPDYWAVTLGWHNGEHWELVSGSRAPTVTIWHPLDKPDLPTREVQIR